ncbi:MAG: chemotaxis protein CheW [Burkholderiaceae bacterium]|nr:chemotaxis protein CheW [Burkholderiaceae bacterium]
MTQPPSFGVRLAGIPVRLPAGTALEYVAQASLHPLPLAPARVAGLMQLRGQPIVVLDPSAGREAGSHAANIALAPHEVLVVGAMPHAVAVLVDSAPQRVPAEEAPLALPLERADAMAHCAFFDAIVSHHASAAEAGAEGGDWYDVDPARLIAALLAD